MPTKKMLQLGTKSQRAWHVIPVQEVNRQRRGFLPSPTRRANSADSLPLEATIYVNGALRARDAPTPVFQPPFCHYNNEATPRKGSGEEGGGRSGGGG